MSITQWKDLTPTQLLALKGLGGEQGVFVRSSLLRALKGDGSAAILLAQLIFWSQTDSAAEHDGWFYLTTQVITKNFAMSKDIQQRVRRLLGELGILEFERRGNPAKNWYRLNLDAIIDLVADQYYETTGAGGDVVIQRTTMSTPSGGDSPPLEDDNAVVLEDGKAPHIVKRLVNPGVNPNSKKLMPTSAGQNTRPKYLNILGDRFDHYLGFVRANYPLDYQGLAASEGEVRAALHKIGRYKPNASEEEQATVRTNMQRFLRAVHNMKRAVDIGQKENRYVPGFGKFAGLGIPYGHEPGYIKMADWKEPVKRRELVV